MVKIVNFMDALVAASVPVAISIRLAKGVDERKEEMSLETMYFGSVDTGDEMPRRLAMGLSTPTRRTSKWRRGLQP